MSMSSSSTEMSGAPERITVDVPTLLLFKAQHCRKKTSEHMEVLVQGLCLIEAQVCTFPAVV